MTIALDGGMYTSSVGRIEEDIVVTLEIVGLQAIVTTSIGIDPKPATTISLDRLAHEPLGCLAPALKGMKITNLLISIDDIVGPTLDGFICSGLDRFINQAR